VGGCGLDASGSRYGPVGGCCEHGDETSGSTTGEEFVEWVSNS
jgi:hypothetical protein